MVEVSSFIYNSYQEPTLPRSKQEFPQPLNTWHLNSLTAFLSSVDHCVRRFIYERNSQSKELLKDKALARAFWNLQWKLKFSFFLIFIVTVLWCYAKCLKKVPSCCIKYCRNITFLSIFLSCSTFFSTIPCITS